MLMPKRVKHRRVHRGRMKGVATKGNTITYGAYGLVSQECGWITSNQIEAARIEMCIRDRLRGVQRDEIERGQVLAKPGTIHPHTKFKGEVYVLKKEEGGRHTPFFNGYRPQFYFRTTDVTGDLQLPERCV